MAFGMASLFIGVLLPHNHNGSSNSNSSVGEAKTTGYEFKVYALNATAMTRALDCTEFLFRASDLPFDFGSISFGDFRSDTNRTLIYYAGSGMLVNATGENATITLRENNGKTVSKINYGGQDQIVFNGEVKSVTYPRPMTTYNGTDLLVQDWRNGIWTPSDGIMVEHPGNVTVESASFFLMVHEPQGTYEVPEFGNIISPLLALLVMVGLMRFLSRTRGSSEPNIEL